MTAEPPNAIHADPESEDDKPGITAEPRQVQPVNQASADGKGCNAEPEPEAMERLPNAPDYRGGGVMRHRSGAHPETGERDDTMLIYCTHCHKTHAVGPLETPCSPGAWIDHRIPPEPLQETEEGELDAEIEAEDQLAARHGKQFAPSERYSHEQSFLAGLASRHPHQDSEQDGGERRNVFSALLTAVESMADAEKVPALIDAGRKALDGWPEHPHRDIERLRDGMRELGFILGRNPDGADDTVEATLLIVREALEKVNEFEPSKPRVTREQIHNAAFAIQEYPPVEIPKDDEAIEAAAKAHYESHRPAMQQLNSHVHIELWDELPEDERDIECSHLRTAIAAYNAALGGGRADEAQEKCRQELAEAFGIPVLPTAGNGWFQLLRQAEVLTAVIKDRADARGVTFSDELRALKGGSSAALGGEAEDLREKWAKLNASLQDGLIEGTQHYHGGDEERVEHVSSWLEEHESLLAELFGGLSEHPEPNATGFVVNEPGATFDPSPPEHPKSDVVIPRSIKLAENAFRAAGFEVEAGDEERER